VVGIVVVSHSAKLAEGVADLAREMGGTDVALEPVGGLDLPDRPMGTDAVLVQAAIERAWSADGVLVLMDLGSAVLSAEMAVEMLPEEHRARVLLCEAPLVEGAVSAAVAARLGLSLEEVAGEARGGLAPKAEHLGAETPGPAPVAPAVAAEGPEVDIRLVVQNPLGLHARPAARLVQTAGSFDADVRVRNLSTSRGPASARSLNAIATLGVRQGNEIEVTARGPQAQAALDAISALAAQGFGDELEPAAAPAPAPRAVPEGAIAGFPASPGIAVGAVRHFRPPAVEVPDRAPGAPEGERAALARALEATRADILATRAEVAARAGEQSAAIFDAHLLFLSDDALLEPTRAAIDAGGTTAAAAWRAAIERAAADWRALDDEYLRARAGDLEAVGNEVLAHLVGAELGRPTLAEPGILVAADLTPADTAGLDPEMVLGIATALGGPTSHTAILARSLGIPAVVGLGESTLAVEEGVTAILDGGAGTLRANPAGAEVADAEARAERFRRTEAEARSSALEPAVTRDGVRVEVFANVGKPEEAGAALEAGAEGIGLLRTEFLFLDRERMPTEEEQEAAYRGVASALEGRPVIVRTLDVGGDKPLPYLPMPAEANPFLGVRGLRLGLTRPEVFGPQLRAVLRAASDHPLRVMFPMVATLDELLAARAALDDARRETIRKGAAAPEVPVGIMVEVPSAALAAATFAPHADFFSIGTNDLAQYALAAERGNERVAALSDALHPAVLRLIRLTVEAAEPLGRTVGVCGELAADPVAVPILIGLGVRELSVGVPAIARVKRAVRETDLGVARPLAEEALGLDSAAAVRALVTDRLGD
jgi:phosphocarrier protein FPr